jgi:phosphonate transport system substrate-binding protein
VFKRIIAALLLGALIMGLAAVPAQPARPAQLVLGMVPSREAGVIVDNLRPLGQLLSQRVGIPVDTFISTDFTGLVEAVGTGRVDIGLFGPFSLVQATDRYGAEVILASVRRGETVYYAQFNVHVDSGIETWADLRGKVLAFVDPASASGYLFPFVFLQQQGLNPRRDMLTVFAGSHDASVLAVYNRDVDAGVSFNDAREGLLREFPDVMEKVRVLGYSSPIPNDGVVVRRGLDPALKEAIAQGLIDIASTEEGRRLTQQLFNVTSFARATSEQYDIVRETAKVFGR